MDEQKELQELSPQPACGGCDGCAGCGGGCKAEPVHETVDDALAAELLPIPPEDAAEDTEPLPEQVTVVDVRFRTGSKVYYFDPGDLTPKMGDHVIIDTARGPEFGFCAGGCHTVPAADVVTPLRPVLRMATPHDEKIAADNYEKEKKAFSICLQKIEEHKLDMQLVSAECAFDGSKILFFFTADGRVDFRELVKNLASIFRTRIELRQIGVRDKARMVGGLGVCGRPFCCAEFLDDFQPVSIKMAKTQNLSLNPTKISGTCGRLMCCLKYEQEAYEDLHKTAPKAESFVDTPDGRGTVCDVNLLRQTVKVRMEDAPDTINVYRNSDIAVLRSGKAKKTDPPIPRDLAPISGQSQRSRRSPLPSEPTDQEIMDSMPDLFRKLDDYAASDRAPELEPDAEEAPEQKSRRRRSRRRSAGPRPEDGQKPQESRPEQPPRSEPGEPKPRQEKPRQSGSQQKPRQERRPRSDKPQEGAAAPAPANAAEGGEHRPRRRRRPRRSGGTGGNPTE